MQLSVNETDSKRSEYPGKGLYICWFYSITEKKKNEMSLVFVKGN